MNWLKNLFLNKYAKSLTRHVAAGLGGLLLGLGLAAEEVAEFVKASEPILYGVVVWAGAWLASLNDKKKNQE